tara:strand:- start:80 stop:619 length:540 start_codon:yes stop_codon:yes gene_type:complete
MNINVIELQTAFATVINTLTSTRVIWSDQNSNTPNGDYIALKLTSFGLNTGLDFYSKPNDSEIMQTQGDRVVTLSLTCTSHNAMQILLQLVDKLQSPNNIELLDDNKIVYINIESDLLDITTNINNSFETRAFVGLTFRISKNYSSNGEEEMKVVRVITLEGELDGKLVPEEFVIDTVI